MSFWKIGRIILGYYAILITIVGTIANILVFIVCQPRELRSVNTFKLISFMSISDLISLYFFNLNHFINMITGVDAAKVFLWKCKFTSYAQYVSLQFSAWIIVSIFTKTPIQTKELLF
jgi:hypothetical protein